MKRLPRRKSGYPAFCTGRGQWRYVVDEVADFYGIVHTRNDFADAHRVEKLLRQREQVLVVSQDKGGVYALSGL